MSFFYLTEAEIASEFNEPIVLRVIQDSGIKVTPQIDIVTTNLKHYKNNVKYKNFFNNGNAGIVFNIDIIEHRHNNTISTSFIDEPIYNITESETLNWVNYWYANMIPLYVVTDAIDIPNGVYLITDNSSRKQEFKDYTVWSLEFTTFTGLSTKKYVNNNSKILDVIQKYKDSKKKTTSTNKNKKASSNSTVKTKLSKCKLTQLKYTGKKQTNVQCVKYLQEILYKSGYLTKKQIDGWYGNKTLNAVKKWQKKYKTKYKLKVTGKMDSATLKAMCK